MIKLLLLEDDPVSQAFLAEVLGTLPAEVDCVDSCAGAESLARTGRYSLWLFDANLPDGNGADLLGRLRESGVTTPALALTAEAFRDRLDALTVAGFADVLRKPIAADSLLAALKRHVSPPPAGSFSQSQLWDESKALAAVGGKPESALALRRLFLDELPSQIDAVREEFAASNHACVRDQLHRLKASCGFVGANRLLAAVNALSARMDRASLEDFLDQATLQLQTSDVMADAV